MLPIRIKETERSDTTNRHSSFVNHQFGSGLSGSNYYAACRGVSASLFRNFKYLYGQSLVIDQAELYAERINSVKAERRKYTRFFVTDDAYAALGPDFTKVGRIKDISMGGLALEYLTDEKNGSENPTVEIFLRTEQFHMTEIPCTIVYSIDLETPDDTLPSNQRLIHKRCGVEFSHLTEDHEKQLVDFLKDHTVSTV